MVFFKDKDKKEKEQHDGEMPDPKDKVYWASLLRGQVLSATMHKFTSFVGLADQKAQAMIILNTILVPVALSWVGKDGFTLSASIAIITAFISIFTAILCIYPKRRRGHKPDGTKNLLHFGDIGKMREDEYLNAFYPVFNDLSELSKEAIKDMHDISRRIIIPKFFWLKISYGCFFAGNMIAIACAIYAIFTNSAELPH